MSFSLASETKSFLQTAFSFFRGKLGDMRGQVCRGFWGDVSGGLRSLGKVQTVLLLVSGLSASEAEFFFDTA